MYAHTKHHSLDFNVYGFVGRETVNKKGKVLEVIQNVEWFYTEQGSIFQRLNIADSNQSKINLSDFRLLLQATYIGIKLHLEDSIICTTVQLSIDVTWVT